MLYMIAVNLDECSIETFAIVLVFRCRNKVVKRTELSVSTYSGLCVRMSVVVKNLELTSEE